jgi:hypothetical protein
MLAVTQRARSRRDLRRVRRLYHKRAIRRISSFRRPTALWTSAERSEFEHKLGKQPGVVRGGVLDGAHLVKTNLDTLFFAPATRPGRKPATDYS